MRQLGLVVTVFHLAACAVPFPVPFAESCKRTECPADQHCVESFDGPICQPNRRESGFCDLQCPEGMECRFDTCISQDPNGATCEFDDACMLDEYCVLARCTQLICIPGEITDCYSGPPETLNIGECRAGYKVCNRDFIWNDQCFDEVLPGSDEGYFACNGRDDNCDGITDDLIVEEVDIVFAVDLSGSMNKERRACAQAILQTAAMYDDPSVNLGLVIFPGYTENWDDNPIIETKVPLMEYGDFIIELSNLLFTEHTSFAYEPSYDLVQQIATGDLPGIQKRENSTLVLILFTDEEGQSYLDPPIGENEVCQAVNESGLQLHVVTDPDEENREDIPFREYWDACAEIYTLSEDPEEVSSHFVDIASSTCN